MNNFTPSITNLRLALIATEALQNLLPNLHNFGMLTIPEEAYGKHVDIALQTVLEKAETQLLHLLKKQEQAIYKPHKHQKQPTSPAKQNHLPLFDDPDQYPITIDMLLDPYSPPGNHTQFKDELAKADIYSRAHVRTLEITPPTTLKAQELTDLAQFLHSTPYRIRKTTKRDIFHLTPIDHPSAPTYQITSSTNQTYRLLDPSKNKAFRLLAKNRQHIHSGTTQAALTNTPA